MNTANRLKGAVFMLGVVLALAAVVRKYMVRVGSLELGIIIFWMLLSSHNKVPSRRRNQCTEV